MVVLVRSGGLGRQRGGSSLNELVKHLLRSFPVLRSLSLRIYNRWFTAEAVARRNSLRAYDRIFGSPRLVEQYLDPGRLMFYEDVAALVEPLDPHTVLDVGCGGGHLLRAVKVRLGDDRELVGVDHSKNAIALARQTLPHADWVAQDLYRLEFGNKFDLVLCVEVLEHLRDPGGAMSLLAKHCAPGGHVVVTVPDGAIDRWEGHANFWTETELREWLEPWGLFDIQRLEEGRVLVAILNPAEKTPTRDAPAVR